PRQVPRRNRNPQPDTRHQEGAPGRQDPDGGLSRLVLGVEVAVGEVEDLVAAFGDAGVVGGDDDDASAPCDCEDELERLLFGCVVKFGGEFVGEQNIGFGDEGARDGDALLLASGQFLDEVVGVAAESDALEHVCRVATYVGSGESAGGKVRLERDFDVLRGGEQVSQTVGLQDEPESGSGRVAVDGARVGTLKAAEEREEAGLAAAGRAGDGDDLAGRGQEGDVIEQGAPSAVIADVGGDQGAQWRLPVVQRRGRALRGPGEGFGHAAVSSVIRPSCSRMVRSRPAATSGSWVTAMTVAARCVLMWRRSSTTRSRFAASSWLVGSSAISTPGRLAAAAARATRCRSPPLRRSTGMPASRASPSSSRSCSGLGSWVWRR